MIITRKNQYALRAIFELAKRRGKGPTKISDIARAQSIPVRFLEVILNQLKKSGLIASKRGYHGGYHLVLPPNEVTVGDIIRFLEKDKGPAQCIACVSKSNCPAVGQCAFSPMWNRIRERIFDVYDQTTIANLMENELLLVKMAPGDKPCLRDTPPDGRKRTGCAAEKQRKR